MQSKCSKRGYFSNRSSNIEPHNKACTHNKACFHSVKVAVMSHQSPLCSRFTTAIDLSSVLHVESLLSVSIPPAASDRPLGQRRTFAGHRPLEGLTSMNGSVCTRYNGYKPSLPVPPHRLKFCEGPPALVDIT